MKLDPKKTAMLTLDFQKGILAMGEGTEDVIPAAARAVEFARLNGYQLIHVGLGFADGYPEIPKDSPMLARVKENKLFSKGSPSIEFHPDLVKPDDLIVYKQRVSAFSENQLHVILRARGIENLVFFGISTSGITLSTIRRAHDLDYQCFVLKDACFDGDVEVHRVLTEKIFPKQATVTTVDEFINGQGA